MGTSGFDTSWMIGQLCVWTTNYVPIWWSLHWYSMVLQGIIFLHPPTWMEVWTNTSTKIQPLPTVHCAKLTVWDKLCFHMYMYIFDINLNIMANNWVWTSILALIEMKEGKNSLVHLNILAMCVFLHSPTGVPKCSCKKNTQIQLVSQSSFF